MTRTFTAVLHKEDDWYGRPPHPNNEGSLALLFQPLK